MKISSTHLMIKLNHYFNFKIILQFQIFCKNKIKTTWTSIFTLTLKHVHVIKGDTIIRRSSNKDRDNGEKKAKQW